MQQLTTSHSEDIPVRTTYALHSRGPARNWTANTERTARPRREFVCRVRYRVGPDTRAMAVLVEGMDDRGVDIAFEPGLAPGKIVVLEVDVASGERTVTFRLPCRVEWTDGDGARLEFTAMDGRAANGGSYGTERPGVA